MDSNLLIRDGTTDLTVDETIDSFKIGPMTKPLWLHVLVPELVADSTLDVTLEFCTEAAPTVAVYSMAMPQITDVGYYSIPFYTRLPYLQVQLNASVDADFGATKVWIDPAHRADAPLDA